jgi:outer membrane protein
MGKVFSWDFIFIIIAFSPLLLASELRAELSWDHCVQLIWDKSPELKAAEKDRLSVEWGIPKVESNFFPSLSLVGTWQPYGYASMPTPPSPYLYQSYGPQLTWTIFSGFQTVAQVREAKAGLKKSDAMLAQEKVKMLSDLRTYFATALYAQKNIEVTERIEQRLSENAKFIHLRYKGGLEAQWAYLKAAADWKEAEWEVGQAKLNRATALTHLAQVLGLENSSNLEVVGDFAIESGLPAPAIEEHPDILVQRFNRESFQHSITEQESGYWPTIGISAYYNLQSYNAPPVDYWGVAATITIPLFSGFLTKASVSQATMNYDREDANLTKIILQTKANLVDAENTYINAKNRIAVSEQELTAAEQRAVVVQEEYSAGLKQFLDYDQAQSLLTSAEKDILQAQFDATTALAVYERAQGKQIPRPVGDRK